MNAKQIVIVLVAAILLASVIWRKPIWRRMLLERNRYYLHHAITVLMWAFEGNISFEDMKMLLVLDELYSGKIPTYVTDNDVQGIFLDETNGDVMFLFARDGLVTDYVQDRRFLPVYIAGQMADVVSMANGVRDEVAAITMREEWMVRAFSRLRERGYDFGEGYELLVDFTEQAQIYREDRALWLTRVRGQIFNDLPYLISAAEA